MLYKPNNHITGKVYDLTQENMQAMIKELEKRAKQIKLYKEIVQSMVMVKND